MAIIKDAELEAARVQIKVAISRIFELAEENQEVYAQNIVDHLNEALAHLNNE